MKSLFTVSFLLLICVFVSAQKMQRFTCNGDGKALGVKFSIEYPNNWTASDGTRPHILKVFTFDDNDTNISFAIYVKKLDEAPSKEMINQVFQKDYLMGYFKDAKLIEFSNDSKIEDLRCLNLSVYMKSKVYDQVAYSIFKNNQIYFKKYHLQFNFTVSSFDQKYETMMKMYNKYNPIFNIMMTSLALNSRWE